MSFAKAESFQTRDARNMTISLTPFRTIRALTPNLPLTHPDRTLSLRGERLRVRGVSAFSFLTAEDGFPSRGKEPARMNRGEDQGSRSSPPSLSLPQERQGSPHDPTGLTGEVTLRGRHQVRIHRAGQLPPGVAVPSVPQAVRAVEQRAAEDSTAIDAPAMVGQPMLQIVQRAPAGIARGGNTGPGSVATGLSNGTPWGMPCPSRYSRHSVCTARSPEARSESN